ncbi:hypothetical protein [Stutzerimonas kunmingensis]|uniref:hypothetical protein n=1 Tax=Stutzerimonas kunmingensis TaxID=1211807 RepID=UPI0028ACA81E|nr:hypothetical protein [Stutzerimonas kunmingensis]
MQHTDKAIAEFEAWFEKTHIPSVEPGFLKARRLQDGWALLKAERLHAAWQVWQAARATLAIELPDAYADCPPYACYEGGWNDMRDEAVDRLEAAGVTVRG